MTSNAFDCCIQQRNTGPEGTVCPSGTGHIWQSLMWRRSSALKGFFCLEERSVWVNGLWKRGKKVPPGGQVKASARFLIMLTHSGFVEYSEYQLAVTQPWAMTAILHLCSAFGIGRHKRRNNFDLLKLKHMCTVSQCNLPHHNDYQPYQHR